MKNANKAELEKARLARQEKLAFEAGLILNIPEQSAPICRCKSCQEKFHERRNSSKR